VQSTSARDLVTNIFRRQAANPQLTRGAALKGAMNALIDSGGVGDAGR
jgi:hypothetical protein